MISACLYRLSAPENGQAPLVVKANFPKGVGFKLLPASQGGDDDNASISVASTVMEINKDVSMPLIDHFSPSPNKKKKRQDSLVSILKHALTARHDASSHRKVTICVLYALNPSGRARVLGVTDARSSTRQELQGLHHWQAHRDKEASSLCGLSHTYPQEQEL